ncbi:hypothetical protein M378DRAFT_172896 [Amanita muscaria Koide BX008]|uniref:Uncharacterized protein n=1 Tax=Amanita muscaria (strain Koide BX008) TaxID=946122 RepID=A0A0C2SQ85_AMAMK|nr:hypothetical protein M378DRAFT_172896 [Amanita muscaria Koide BX008]
MIAGLTIGLLFFGALIWPNRPWGNVVGCILYWMLPSSRSSQHNDDVFDLVQLKRNVTPYRSTNFAAAQQVSVWVFVPGTTYTASSFCWHIEQGRGFWTV